MTAGLKNDAEDETVGADSKVVVQKDFSNGEASKNIAKIKQDHDNIPNAKIPIDNPITTEEFSSVIR